MSVARILASLVVVVGVFLLVLAGFRSGESPPDSSVAASVGTTGTTVAPYPTVASGPIPVLGAAKPLVGIDGWLNTEATSFDEARGVVTIVHFWTFGCRNCKNTLPYLQDIYATYHAQGLEIVGVHAPEFAYEADPNNVASAVVDLGVTWPVALDTDRTNFRSWQQGGRRYWPRTFVVDAEGGVRFDWIGEGAYDRLEETVAVLLAGEA